MFDEFRRVRLNTTGQAKVEEAAAALDDCLATLLRIIDSTPTRETSIMRTKLEEACFFAIKAISKQPTNQEP